jgi:hypothetical protein
MVESFRGMSPLITTYSPDASHLYGMPAAHLLGEALAKTGLCRPPSPPSPP